MSIERFFKDGLLWLADPASAQPSTPSLPRSESTEPGYLLPPLAQPQLIRAGPYIRFGLNEIDSQFPGQGLPIGTVHEWFSTESSPPCSFFALAAGNILRQTGLTLGDGRTPQKYIAWIGRDIWPTPYLLEQTMYLTVQDGAQSTSKSLLPQCLFIDPPDEKLKLWAIELALRSPAVAVVAASTKKLRFAISRKLALAARSSKAVCFLFCDKKSLAAPSAAFARWHIAPVAHSSSVPCFQLQLLRCKGAQPRTSSWMVELQEGVSMYERNQPTLSLSLSTAVGRHHGPLSPQQRTPAADTADHPRQQTRQSAHR